MQQKSDKFSEFSERTQDLAMRIGINLSDLPEKIGVSNSMFHAYRSGKNRISDKAWKKLEAAERAAGLGPVAAPDVEVSSQPEERRSQTSSTDPALMAVLEKIASALEVIANNLAANNNEGHKKKLRDWSHKE